ncbi:MAG TPA: hypothetical protein VNT55_25890, partial [Baekduia sp.]|nr:hypothetical protein [Baekduia sp.]
MKRAPAAAAAAVLAAFALANPQPGTSQNADVPPSARPAIGLPAQTVVPFGATPAETWAFGRTGADPPTVGDHRAPADAFVLLRQAGAGPWRAVQDLAGFSPLAATETGAGRVTPRGGGLLLGLRVTDPTILLRAPGGDFTAIAAPTDTLDDGETLFTAQDAVFAALDEDDDTTGALIAPHAAGGIDTAVLHYTNNSWTREAINYDAGRPLTAVALDATSPDNAWLLATPAPATRKAFLLFHRTHHDDGTWTWEPRDLGDSRFAATRNDDLGISAVTISGFPAQPLTVTPDGLWVDGRLRTVNGASSFTAFYNNADGPEQASWCDVQDATDEPLCPNKLGADLATADGYRSFAWSATDRIITNPLRPGGDRASARGTYLRLENATTFRRRAGAGAQPSGEPAGGAFASSQQGWLAGTDDVVELTTRARPAPPQAWPLTGRRPLIAVAPEPGKVTGALDAQALAVGASGAIARYLPGTGWMPEFLLTSSGARVTPRLRGVAWPEPTRAYAVGDRGEMWLWRAATGLWERDEAAPEELITNLTGVAFQPGNPQRGYVIGQQGTVLHYDKTWIQDPLPAEAATKDLNAIAFAGAQAIVAAGDTVLTNDGGGWAVDRGATALLASVHGSAIAVAGLPDGGAVLAGRDAVLVRDTATGPWRLTDQPLSGASPVAVAALRDGGTVRALVSASTEPGGYPQTQTRPEQLPGEPPIQPDPLPLPNEGLLLRETADGWVDVQRARFRHTTQDAPGTPDPVLALAVDASGAGWAVGGVTGADRSSGVQARVQTASVLRLGATGSAPSGSSPSPVPLTPGLVRFAVGGHAACASDCADLAQQGLGPDVGLSSVLQRAGDLAARPSGPRAFLYTGGRVEETGATGSRLEADRYADIARAAPLPFYPALSAGDVTHGGAAAIGDAFAAFPSPLGAGVEPRGVTSGAIPGAGGSDRARTHYAFDSYGGEGTVRVIVIDNAQGSLSASDPDQYPAEAQEPWLRSVLQDARATGIPAIVVGSRDLSTATTPASNVATDADALAQLLVDEG